MKPLFRLFIVLCLTIGLAGFVFGQETTGNIKGEVRDANGAAIPNATVTATSPQRSWTATTDQQGDYQFQQLSPGRYVVSVIAQGFANGKREDVPVELG